MKQVYSVIFSPTGGTRKLAQAIGEGTSLPFLELNYTILHNPPEVPLFGPHDLVVVGLPVYSGRLPQNAVPFLQRLKGNATPCLLLVSYGNRHYDDALVELEDTMKKQDFVPIAAAAFTAQHSFTDELGAGHPNADELEKARKLGADVIEKFQAGNWALPEGRVPGARPYRPLPGAPKVIFGPVVDAHCTKCGKCATVCPTGAIPAKNVGPINAEKCMRCRACARICPVGAIDFTAQEFEDIKAYLLREFLNQTCEPLVVL